MNYVRVFENKIIEIRKNITYKPAGVDWFELEQNKPNFDRKKEYLVHDYFEILENKVVEHFKVEAINFEPMPVDENEIF